MIYKIENNNNNLAFRFKNISLNYNNWEYRNKDERIIHQYKIFKNKMIYILNVPFRMKNNINMSKCIHSYNFHEKPFTIKGDYKLS